VEERDGSTVEIDVADLAPDPSDPPDGPAPIDSPRPTLRPPVAIERAALRIAELAVVNAVRHGTGRVRVGVQAGPASLRLEIANPGPPFDAAAAREAIRRGARGLTEMREVAAEIDAGFEIAGGPSGGTVVRLVWPRA
jgi:signal transduction histidine kinase